MSPVFGVEGRRGRGGGEGRRGEGEEGGTRIIIVRVRYGNWGCVIVKPVNPQRLGQITCISLVIMRITSKSPRQD